jgi:hypothetical protein
MQIKLIGMERVFAAIMVLLAGLAASTAEAGFRSPDSLIRNIYSYYGNGASDYSMGLPRDPDTAQRIRACAPHGARRGTRLTISWCRARPGNSARSESRSCAGNTTFLAQFRH